MARRIRNANPVTLFPFLAVLMCTIGALVLLLVVISAQIRGSAVQQFVQRQQQATPPAVADVESPPSAETGVIGEPAAVAAAEPEAIEPVIVVAEADSEPRLPADPPAARIPPLVPASDEQLARIDALKVRAAALRDDYKAAVEELDGLTQKRGALAAQLKLMTTQEADLQKSLRQAVTVVTQAGKQAAALNVENRQIIELLEQSDELIRNERKRVATPQHALVPYDGQTGTIRRPIVIECAAGTIRFEAENVELDAKRLEEYPPGVNPLMAGIQTLFSYWTEEARAAGRTGVAAQPYALLIVRPSGADQFRLARVLLQSLVGDYGYEFVEESFEYAVPPTTEEAAQRCREAVAAAFRLKPRGPGVGSLDFVPGGGGGGSGDRPGGVVVPSGPIDVERLTQRPAASRGFFSSGSFRRRLTGAEADDADGGFGGGLAETSADRSAGDRSAADRPAGDANVSETSNRGGAPGVPGAIEQQQRQALADAAANGSGQAAAAEQAAQADASGVVGEQSSPASRLLSGPSAARQSSGDAARANGPTSLEPVQRDDTPNTRREAQSAVADFLAKARALRESQASQAGAAGSAAGNAARSGDTAASSDSGQETEDAQTGVETQRRTAEADTAAGTAAADVGGDSASGNSSGGEAAASGPASLDLSSRSKETSGAAAQKRWGQSGPNATLGLERPVTFVVGPSRVLIVDAYQITLRPEWSELQAANVCLKGLELTANDWGQPGDRFYWVPVVTLRIEAGGESLARLLESSLKRLGVMVEHEPAFLEPAGRN